jgi:hypothetical protein
MLSHDAETVMVGAAAEGTVLRVLDALVGKLEDLEEKFSSDLTHWGIKRVLDALQRFLAAKVGAKVMPKDLRIRKFVLAINSLHRFAQSDTMPAIRPTSLW